MKGLIIIPTPKTLNMQSAQYNKINVGVWKDTTGKITASHILIKSDAKSTDSAEKQKEAEQAQKEKTDEQKQKAARFQDQDKT